MFKKKIRIVIGGTRIVLLAGKYAIKFPKLFTLRPLKSALNSFDERIKEKKEKNINYYAVAKNIVAASLTCFLSGLVSNIRENSRWRESESELLAPTYFTFLGLINVQVRVERVLPHEDSFLSEAYKLHEERYDSKDDFPDNKGYYQGRIVFLDYGFKESPL